MEKEKRRNDIILISIILILAIAGYAAISIYQRMQTKGAEAVVQIDGEEYGRYLLSVDVKERIELPDGSYNILVIKDGKAFITEASCPDQYCVKHSAIDRQNQSIVCLPNKVVVEIENGDVSEFDTIAN